MNKLMKQWKVGCNLQVLNNLWVYKVRKYWYKPKHDGLHLYWYNFQVMNQGWKPVQSVSMGSCMAIDIGVSGTASLCLYTAGREICLQDRITGEESGTVTRQYSLTPLKHILTPSVSKVLYYTLVLGTIILWYEQTCHTAWNLNIVFLCILNFSLKFSFKVDKCNS
jgi:hypothetical protein